MDISKVESAFSAGTTRFEQWKARDDERWMRPIIRTQIAAFIHSLTPEQRKANENHIALLESKLGLGGTESGNQIHWTGKG